MEQTPVVILRPAEVSELQLGNFKHLLLSGGEVAADGLDDRIRGAELLAFLFDDQRSLSGIAALKNPVEGYRSKVFRRAGVPDFAADYPFELGWVYVAKSARNQGHSKRLIDGLLQHSCKGNIYATTREDNEPMIRTLTRSGFNRVGNPYLSDRRSASIILMRRPSA